MVSETIKIKIEDKIECSHSIKNTNFNVPQNGRKMAVSISYLHSFKYQAGIEE